MMGCHLVKWIDLNHKERNLKSSRTLKINCRQLINTSSIKLPSFSFYHWYKDFRWANEVKEDEGLPAFAPIKKSYWFGHQAHLGPIMCCESKEKDGRYQYSAISSITV
ncbi:hypothetical protein IEQ34_000582 [Dendrobium chrysotoxum]|uniref:Uncharacterized protein n=1 Tax=Dendrobium chrysotoxum TaxID=161865 RepID=A0AAV7HRM2_DENCH|nr:hypothetical protein IEQ34_000582 [Dendrobium chrysotoxum]